MSISLGDGLCPRPEKLGHAATAAASHGMLLDDADLARQGQELYLLLHKAMGEARVQSRQRAASGELTPDLLVDATTTTPGGEVVPVATGASSAAELPG